MLSLGIFLGGKFSEYPRPLDPYNLNMFSFSHPLEHIFFTEKDPLPLTQRELPSRQHVLPSGSPHPMTGWCWAQRPGPTPLIGRTIDRLFNILAVSCASWPKEPTSLMC